MRPPIRRLLIIAMVALCAAQGASARTHHRTSKATTPAVAVKPDAKIPVEVKRDPADIALDRKIKGICKGC
jgi:hypothetical protein